MLKSFLGEIIRAPSELLMLDYLNILLLVKRKQINVGRWSVKAAEEG